MMGKFHPPRGVRVNVTFPSLPTAISKRVAFTKAGRDAAKELAARPKVKAGAS